tara:strand:+ start:6647 stop:6928 length:282 start_codon:yes stop_codon:yes gene_type:complete
MDIIHAFKILQRHGYVVDQYSFDQSWLGKKPGYFAYLKSTKSEPSVEALMRLHLRLLEQEERDARWGLATGAMADLASSMMDEIKQRCRPTNS